MTLFVFLAASARTRVIRTRFLIHTHRFRALLFPGVATGSRSSTGRLSGLLYGILKQWKLEDAMHFGWATGAMATTMLEDYASPADEDQVWSVWKGNARVKR